MNWLNYELQSDIGDVPIPFWRDNKSIRSLEKTRDRERNIRQEKNRQASYRKKVRRAKLRLVKQEKKIKREVFENLWRSVTGEKFDVQVVEVSYNSNFALRA